MRCKRSVNTVTDGFNSSTLAKTDGIIEIWLLSSPLGVHSVGIVSIPGKMVDRVWAALLNLLYQTKLLNDLVSSNIVLSAFKNNSHLPNSLQ